MSQRALRDPLAKRALRAGWRVAQTARTLAAAPVSGGGLEPRVFYGGARSGDVGGPLVKVQRLRAHFSEHCWRYNLVYGLSNAVYLPPAAMAVLRWRGVPMVHNQNGVFWPGWFHGDWRKRNAVMAEAYRRADYVFWQSEFCRAAADRFLGARPGPGEVLFNAIDLSRFHPADERPSRPFTLLLTGKIDEHMAYRLISAVEGLAAADAMGAPARLTVAGWIAPAAQAQARARARALGVADHVDFTGAYTQQRAPEIYRSADAYINTTYKDACPNAVIEALASGLPVIHSDSGGAPELVGPEAGVGLPVPDMWDRICPPESEAVGAALAKVIAAPNEMARAARRRAEARFGLDHWIERHRAVFTDLLTRNQEPRVVAGSARSHSDKLKRDLEARG